MTEIVPRLMGLGLLACLYPLRQTQRPEARADRPASITYWRST